jgi:hypothetical protein
MRLSNSTVFFDVIRRRRRPFLSTLYQQEVSMNTVKTTAGDHGWPRKQMIEYATLTPEDKAQIAQCRGTHNRLGFAYQIAFVRLMNRFPAQQPLEIIQEVLDFVGVQLGIETSQIQ